MFFSFFEKEKPLMGVSVVLIIFSLCLNAFQFTVSIDITSASEITRDKCIITDLNMVCPCSLDDFIVRNVCADLQCLAACPVECISHLFSSAVVCRAPPHRTSYRFHRTNPSTPARRFHVARLCAVTGGLSAFFQSAAFQ